VKLVLIGALLAASFIGGAYAAQQYAATKPPVAQTIEVPRVIDAPAYVVAVAEELCALVGCTGIRVSDHFKAPGPDGYFVVFGYQGAEIGYLLLFVGDELVGVFPE
jgi:hypothetical protein